jgi:prolyl 4-hydroxylase
MSLNAIERAYELASRQMLEDAVAVLETSGADAQQELALWYLRGDLLPRDLAKARQSFRLAAESGNEQSRRIHYSLLANGVGGPADWPAAIQLLAQHAEFSPEAAVEFAVLQQMTLGEDGAPKMLPNYQQLSDAPDVRLFEGFMSKAECDYLIARAEPLLQPSTIVDPATGRLRGHPIRTSDGAMFPWVIETPAIHAINRRIADASRTDVMNGEPLQVLSYRPGQEYKAHLDALPGTANQRMWTMLVYLNDGYAGGETLFIRTGLKVKGRSGDALLFRNADADGRADPNSLHAGMPVMGGRKLLASRWIHQERFGPR